MDLQQMTDNSNKAINNDIIAKGNNIFKMLVEDKRSICNKMPEHIFVNYFLPMFLEERKDNPNWVIEWIGIAGSPTAEMEIVDSYTGSTLFYVPGIINTENIGNNKGNRFKDIFTRYEMHNNNSPAQGTRFINEQINTKMKEVISTETNQHQEYNNQQWGYILNKYRQQPSAQITQPEVNDLDSLMDF